MVIKKKNHVLPWAITTASVGAFLIVVNVLLSGVFKLVINTITGDNGRVELLNEDAARFSPDEGIIDKATAKANGNRVNIEICEEGMTLLKNKNNALPLRSGAKVSIFGKNSSNCAIGGSGSGGASADGLITLFDALTQSGFQYNPTLKAFYDDNSKSGDGRVSNNKDLDSGSEVPLSEDFVGETPASSYTDDIWNSCENYKDAALIVLTRIGGEGADLPRKANDHSLRLRPAERDLIANVKSKGFAKIVVLLNTAAAMELGELQNDDGIDSILVIGYTGTSGMVAVGEILKGEKLDGTKFSPSGKTVDIYAADFTKDPTWNNFGAALGGVTKGATYVGGDAYYYESRRGVTESQLYFADYEEGIYYGYRYYETAAAENYINYDDAVVYPFGYGLSYTNFSWELTNYSRLPDNLDKDTEMTFKVNVKNEGEYPGRDTVELYVTPHYNRGGLEKSAKVLVGFAKTKLLAPGASEEVEIKISSPYEYATYDEDGITGQIGYVVEKGTDYIFTLSTDSHHAKDMEHATFTASISADIHYDKDPVTGTRVENLFTDNQDKHFNIDTQLGSVLHRNDFAGTWPQTRTTEEKLVGSPAVKDGWEISEEWIAMMLNDSGTPHPNNPNEYTEMPTYGANNNIQFFELINEPKHSKKWSDFMDQLTLSEISAIINKGAFVTEGISRLGVPPTDNTDGPVGWVNFLNPTTYHDTCSYCCEVIVASTWNIDRAYDMGVAIGNEGVIGTTKEARNKPYTGWYAPGINIHRSPFGGRNFEYYSEDPLLSGQLAASISKGLASKGCYATPKHFAANETETHRSIQGLVTWLNEQTYREIYLKPFEICMKGGTEALQEHEYFGDFKTAKPLSIMTSFNRVGELWTGGDYRLCTTVLRDEWGFEGFVICDFNTCSHMICKDMFYAGGDLNLEMAGSRTWSPSSSSATDVQIARDCAENILYVVAQSNAIRGEFKIHMPMWQIGMYIGTGVIAAGLITWGGLVFFFKYKKKPE